MAKHQVVMPHDALDSGRSNFAPAPAESTIAARELRGLAEVSAACMHGVLQRWDQLLAADASATLYQGREWCMAWYQCYADEFDPLVLAVTCGGTLVGLVPLCVERRTAHLVFAGGDFSDYRDVLALPEYREQTLCALLRHYGESGAPNTLRIGPMPPDSPSAGMLPELLRRTGTRGIARSHSGWRYLAALANADTSPLKNKTLKYNYNWYKRNGGTIDVEVITDRDQWAALAQIFFDQHSLRQLSAGRDVSFDDPRKVALFDRMFDSECGHFCVLRANDRVIATHFGFRTGSLLHWGAPAFDIREAARSPSLLLVAIIMMDLARWNLSGLDLTIGEGFLKERFSNVRVDLPSFDLYPTAASYHVDRFRTRISAAAKTRPALMRLGKRAADFASRARSVTARHGIRGTVALLGRNVGRSLFEFNTGLVLTVTPETLKSVPSGIAGEQVRHGVNAYEDLLRSQGSDVMTSYTIRTTAESIVSNAKAGRILHTLAVDGKLACLGLSYLPNAPATLTETGNLEFAFEPGSASLYAFYTIPEFRGRGLYQQLLVKILAWHFDAGVKLAYISVLESNVASLRAIERVGFKRVQRNSVQRIGSLKRVRRVDYRSNTEVGVDTDE